MFLKLTSRRFQEILENKVNQPEAGNGAFYFLIEKRSKRTVGVNAKLFVYLFNLFILGMYNKALNVYDITKHFVSGNIETLGTTRLTVLLGTRH